MKKEKMYQIGKKLEMPESDVKAALQKNRNKIIAGLIIGFTAIIMQKVWFEPLHYIGGSIVDFNFFTQFF